MKEALNGASGEEPATAEQWAAMEFEAWPYRDDERGPPTDQEWLAMMNPVLVTWRLAWHMCHRTKAQLVEAFDALDDEAGNALLDRLEHAREFFEAAYKTLNCAQSRFIAAGTFAEIRDGKTKPGEP